MAVSRIQELLGLMQKNLECAICLEQLTNPVATKCEHYFCRFCITEFLEQKRSVPCPLCKQPITKRSLQERAEIGSIVTGVSNLIAAFQEDSGTVYSPPGGPQSFFPCTPEAINIKADGQKIKTKKNVRASRRAPKTALKNAALDTTAFAVPNTLVQSPTAPKSPLAFFIPPSATAASVAKRPESYADKTRSPNPAQNTASCTSHDLIQYLNEGSCGKEALEEDTPVQIDLTDLDEERPGRSTRQKKRTRALDSTTASGNREPDIVIYDENQDEVAVQCLQTEGSVALDVAHKNEKNSAVQIDKENLTTFMNASPQKRSKGNQQKSGLTDSSQNSSETSIMSTQNFLQVPVVTRTYGRRSSERSIQNWIDALPSAERCEKKTDHKFQQKTQHKQNESCRKEAVESTDRTETEGSVPGKVVDGTLDIHLDEISKVVLVNREAPVEKELNQETNIDVPEPCEEFMLTPPVRKKPIFRRKDSLADGKDSLILEQSFPLTDPYTFVGGHTPVSKSKKRGQRQTKGKSSASLHLNKDVRKAVHFLFIDPQSECDQRGTSDTSTVLNCEEFIEESTCPADAAVTEPSKEAWDLDKDSLFETLHEDLAVSKKNTRSKSRSQNKSQNKKDVAEGGQVKSRMSSKKDDSKGDQEAQKMREEQTRELASWIGQAEDHNLLFSTQEAQASIESMGTDSGNEDSTHYMEEEDVMDAEHNDVIAVSGGDDDSNDGICLVGPLPTARPTRLTASQQNRNFDAISPNSAETPLVSQDKKQTAGESYSEESSLGGRKAELPVKAKTTIMAVEIKKKHSPTTSKVEQECEALPSPHVGTLEKAEKIAYAELADTEMFSFKTSASSNIVLPSPMIGSTLPKFSTPKLQNARQTRSSRRVMAQQVADNISTKMDKQKIHKNDDISENGSTKQDSELDDVANPVIGQHPVESHKHSPGHLRNQESVSSTTSPLVTTIPATFTEDTGSETMTVSPTPNRGQGKTLVVGTASGIGSDTLALIPNSEGVETHPSKSPEHRTLSLPPKPQVLSKDTETSRESPEDSGTVTVIPSSAEDENLPHRNSDRNRLPKPSKSPASSKAKLPNTVQLLSKSPADSMPSEQSGQNTRSSLRRKCIKTRSKEHQPESREDYQLGDVKHSSGHYPSYGKEIARNLQDPVSVTVQVAVSSEVTDQIVSVELSLTAEKGSMPEDRNTKSHDVDRASPLLEAESHDGVPLNPEGDSDSSSTDDLNIDPDETEFEIPDMTLQSMEIQQRLSGAEPTEDSLALACSASGFIQDLEQSPATCKTYPLRNAKTEDSPVSRNAANRNRESEPLELQEHNQSLKKNTSLQGERRIYQQNSHDTLVSKRRMASSLDSAVTRVPESLEPSYPSSSTQSPDANYSANENDLKIQDQEETAVTFQQMSAQCKKKRSQPEGGTDTDAGRESHSLVEKAEIKSSDRSSNTQFSSAASTPSPSILVGAAAVSKEPATSNSHQFAEKPDKKKSMKSESSQSSSPEQSGVVQCSSSRTATPSPSVFQNVDETEPASPLFSTNTGKPAAGTAMSERSQKGSSEHSSANHFSSASASPSPSILQVVKLATGPAPPQSSGNYQQTTNTSELEPAVPEKQACIENEIYSVKESDDVQPTVKGQDTVQVQVPDQNLVMECASVEQEKYSADQRSSSKKERLVKICAENEENDSDVDPEDPEEEEHEKSKILVGETQCPDTVDDQSIPILLPEQCVADSLPEDMKHLNQSPGKEIHHSVMESQAVDSHCDVSSLLGSAHLETSVTPPGLQERFLIQNLPGESQSCSEEQEKNEDLPSEKSNLPSPAHLRKRNKHELSSEISLTKNHRSLITPPYFQSPSSSSDKVINSAPSRTTSVPLGSDDDDDAVLIVRRTKRKCFSLDGSPLKARTPLSTKRRKYGTRLTNLTEKFDQDKGCNIEASLEHVVESENRTEDNDDSHPILLQEENDLQEKLVGEDHPGQGEPETGCTANDEDMMHTASEKTGQSDPVPNISPLTRRKKTARGLTRYSAVSEAELPHHEQMHSTGAKPDGQSSPLGQNGSAQSKMSPSEYVTRQKSKTGSKQEDFGSNFGAQEKPASTPTHKAALNKNLLGREEDSANLSTQRSSSPGQAAVVSDEEPMLVDENTSVENHHAQSMSTFNRQRRSTPEVITLDENTVHHNQASQLSSSVLDHGENNVIVIQESARSQTQKPATQSSVPQSIDGTLPPPDFDLRFDDDNEEEINAGVLENEPGIPIYSSDIEREMEAKSFAVKDAAVTPGDQQIGDEMTHVGDEDADTGNSSLRSSAAVQENKDQRPLALGGERSEEGEEEEVVVKKKSRRAIIDSDSESDHNSGRESEASFQLNFTSSSALSSQSEIPTTQERSKMETELERLRKEIAEMETRLQGRSSCPKSDSVEDSCDMNSSRHHGKRGTKARIAAQDSSDDEIEELSDIHSESSGKKPKRACREKSVSWVKRSHRPRRISSDDDDDEEGEVEEPEKQPKQQLMDAYVYEVNKDEKEDECKATLSGQAHSHLSPVHTPNSKIEDGEEVSDEDSNDLFLSPLSPSPPPPFKHSLARKETYAQPRSLFRVDFPALSSSATRIRPSLSFEDKGPAGFEKPSAAAIADTMYEDMQDSQESSTEISGSLKNIPESQFSVSCTGGSAQDKFKEMNSSEKAAVGNDVDSSGSPLPSPLKKKRLEPIAGDDKAEETKEKLTGTTGVDRNVGVCTEHNNSKLIGDAYDSEEDKENVNGNMPNVTNVVVSDGDGNNDDDDLPRWKRKKFAFISSGLDSEKTGVLRKLAESNECKVYSKFNEKVTHVIMKSSTDSRVCDRTLKYFQGIAGQCWVLSYNWVLSSMQAGQFVPEKHYEIKGDSVKGEHHQGPRSSRRSTFPLLEDFAFAAVGVSPDMSKKELNQLLTLTGADVVEDPWDLAGHAAKHKLVLRCVDSDSQPPTPAEIELFNGQYKHFRLVTVAREWILDSICTWSLQPLQDYVFNTCKDLCLPF